MNPNTPTLKYIIIKTTKVKERILKAAREKERVIKKGIPIRLSVGSPCRNFAGQKEVA